MGAGYEKESTEVLGREINKRSETLYLWHNFLLKTERLYGILVVNG